jgi:hypothetical protein
MARSHLMKVWKLLADAKFTGRGWDRAKNERPEALPSSGPEL